MSASRESRLREMLAHEGLQPTRWSNGPHAVYAMHDHPYRKVLVVAEGAITFTLHPRDESPRIVAMKPNDRLDLPAHTPHSAVVGPDGVVCLEAQGDGCSRGR